MPTPTPAALYAAHHPEQTMNTAKTEALKPKQRRPTVMETWLLCAAAKLEMDAEASLPSWIVIGKAHRYCEDIGLARALREAAGIKSIAARRRFLRAVGIAA